MSDIAIRAVTSALQDLLLKYIAESEDNNISNADVTVLPLDKAQDGDRKRINLFLYNVVFNSTWRNIDSPTWHRTGGQGSPPLAVDLYYLLTAYDQQGEESSLLGQHLLGRAMSILQDKPILNPTLHKQIESIRITPQPLSLDEMSKLWTTFQTQYRTSVAYQVSVVLIESQKESSTPLPILQRGRNDSGIISQPNLIPPVPTLTKIILPNKQPALHCSDEWTIEGYHLQGDASPTVRLIHPRLETPFEIENEHFSSQTATQIILSLKKEDDPEEAKSKFPPGLYRLVVVVPEEIEPEEDVEPEEEVPKKVVLRVTNELPLPLAPKITGLTPQTNNGLTTLTVTCEPDLLPDQQVTLFVGSKAFSEYSFGTDSEGSEDRGSLIFTKMKLDPDTYLVRLRVDGVDSLPVVDYTAVPLRFDDAQKVTI